jgi:hypothetical protein
VKPLEAHSAYDRESLVEISSGAGENTAPRFRPATGVGFAASIGFVLGCGFAHDAVTRTLY